MIFVDTSAFYAFYDHSDQDHAKAVAGFEKVKKSKLYTTNMVLAELFTLLRMRGSVETTTRIGRAVLSSELLEIVRPGLTEEAQALEWFGRVPADDLSFVDCMSFAVMKRRGLHKALTFDGHFQDAGFEVLPGLPGKA